jgi:hypothetical protein
MEASRLAFSLAKGSANARYKATNRCEGRDALSDRQRLVLRLLKDFAHPATPAGA